MSTVTSIRFRPVNCHDLTSNGYLGNKAKAVQGHTGHGIENVHSHDLNGYLTGKSRDHTG